jgi:hypothetical protein
MIEASGTTAIALRKAGRLVRSASTAAERMFVEFIRIAPEAQSALPGGFDGPRLYPHLTVDAPRIFLPIDAQARRKQEILARIMFTSKSFKRNTCTDRL